MDQPNNELFGGVFYINLEHRKDRREQIEGELNKLGLKYERFPAIQLNPGNVGCGLSHLAVMKIAKERNLKNVFIIEDDFQLIVEPAVFWSEMNNFFESKIDYDVVFSSYNMYKSAPYNNIVRKVLDTQTASSYIVNAHYYDTLINLWEYSIPILADTHNSVEYAIDMIWKRLQPHGNWYAFNVRLGKQRPSYSDNERSFQDYGKYELQNRY